MRDFSISVDIDAPPDRVWNVMSDGERWPEWTKSVTSVKVFGKPLRVGSRAIIKQPGFPHAFWKVTELVPGRSFTWVSWAPGMKVFAKHSVEPIGVGARATLSLRFEGMLGGWFGKRTKDVNNRYLAMEAAGLKSRSEMKSVSKDTAG